MADEYKRSCELGDKCRCEHRTGCPHWAVWEMFEGKLTRVIDASRTGWWRYHQHYDRDGYCDNPARGY